MADSFADMTMRLAQSEQLTAAEAREYRDRLVAEFSTQSRFERRRRAQQRRAFVMVGALILTLGFSGYSGYAFGIYKEAQRKETAERFQVFVSDTAELAGAMEMMNAMVNKAWAMLRSHGIDPETGEEDMDAAATEILKLREVLVSNGISPHSGELRPNFKPDPDLAREWSRIMWMFGYDPMTGEKVTQFRGDDDPWPGADRH